MEWFNALPLPETRTQQAKRGTMLNTHRRGTQTRVRVRVRQKLLARIIAFAIEKLDGRAGLRGWAWIFLIEGLATVFVAIVAYWYMCDYPDAATFLTEDERAFVIERLKYDSVGMASHWDSKFVWQALGDWKCWMQVGLLLSVGIPVFALTIFMPTIITELGYKATTAQLLSTPPYVAACISTIAVGIISDKLKLRGPFIILCSLVSIVGYAIVYAAPANNPGLSYAGIIIVAIGGFPSIPVIVAWAGGNAGGDIKRGVAIAMAIGMANMGGICASFVYRIQDAPKFHFGHMTAMSFLLLALVGSCVAMITYSRLNKQKDIKCREEGIDRSQAIP